MNAPQVAGPYILAALICDRAAAGTKQTGFLSPQNWFELPSGGRVDFSNKRLALRFSRRQTDADSFVLEVILLGQTGPPIAVTPSARVTFAENKANAGVDITLAEVP